MFILTADDWGHSERILALSQRAERPQLEIEGALSFPKGMGYSEFTVRARRNGSVNIQADHKYICHTMSIQKK